MPALFIEVGGRSVRAVSGSVRRRSSSTSLFLTRADGTSQNAAIPVQPARARVRRDQESGLVRVSADHELAGLSNPATSFRTASTSTSASSARSLIRRSWTLAYVGTQGRKLFSQYEANPGDPGLCLSLRGSGVAKGTLQCGPNQENAIFTRPDGSLVYGTRGPAGI